MWHRVALCLAGLFLGIGWLCPWAATVSAHASWTPVPVLAQAVPGTTTTLADRMATLTEAAANALSFLSNQIEGTYLPYFVLVAQGLSAGFIIISLLRYLREHEGADETFVFWFGRVLVCLILIGSAPAVLAWMHDLGIAFAFGTTNGDVGRDSFLQRGYLEQSTHFNENYERFYRNMFLVKVPSLDPNGTLPFSVVPDPHDPGTVFLGILKPNERGGESFKTDNQLNLETMTMPQAFGWFTFGRWAFEISEFVVLVVLRLVTLALILFSPLAAAAAIDKGGAQRFSINFAWGAAVVLILVPVVIQMLRIIGYSAGNIAFSLGDTKPIAIWNQIAMRPVTEPGSFPVFTVLVLAGVMFLCGLLQFFAFVLAYKFSTGQVAEAVSSTAQGWITTVASAGVGYYSSTGAAALQKQAEMVQAGGQAEAGRVTAAGERHQEIIRAAAGYQSEVARASGAYRGEQARAAGNYQGNLTRNSADAKAEGFRNRAEEHLVPTDLGNKFAHGVPAGIGGVLGPLVEGAQVVDDFTRGNNSSGVFGQTISSQPGYILYQKALEQAPTAGSMARPYLEKMGKAMETSQHQLGTGNPVPPPNPNNSGAAINSETYGGQRTPAQKAPQPASPGSPSKITPLNLPPGTVPNYGASQWGNIDSLPVNPSVARTHVGILNSEFLHTQRDQASKREYEGNLEGAKDAFDGQVAAAGITRQGAVSAADVKFETTNKAIGITHAAAEQAATMHEAAQRMNALGSLLSRVLDKAGDSRF